MIPLTPLQTDAQVVVIGGGIAGMLTALLLAPRRVALVHPARIGTGSSSELARGGIACASHKDDDSSLHALDTIVAADGLADAHVVDHLTGEAPAHVLALETLGVLFDRDAKGELCRGLEAAHSRARVLSAGGDTTGAAICEALRSMVAQSTHIELLEGWSAVFMSSSFGRLDGVVLRDPDKVLRAITSAAVVLATGGVGQLYAATSNPLGALGHGLALAHQAGAALIDLEFVQFHPTGLLNNGPVSALLTEALRGAGALLVRIDETPLMTGVHAELDLAPRDIVARAIHNAAVCGQQSYLDLRPIASLLPASFPGALAACHAAGFDPKSVLIPIAPVAHYHMGGVEVDLLGRTHIAGLWALGEVACTGLHGANRLASNSLMEIIVMAHRVSAALRDVEHGERWAGSYSRLHQALLTRIPNETRTWADDEVLSQIKKIMTQYVGIIRNDVGLREALDKFKELRCEGALSPETALTLDAAELITQACVRRTASCGAHHRSDSSADIARYRLRRTGERWEQLVLEIRRIKPLYRSVIKE
jgi:L-aspartate oxidase